MITRINKAKILTKNISCDYKCKFDGKKLTKNISCDYKCKFDGKKLFQIKREVKTSIKIRWMWV